MNSPVFPMFPMFIVMTIGIVVVLTLMVCAIAAVIYLVGKNQRQFKKRSVEVEKIDTMLKNGKITEAEALELKKAIGVRSLMSDFKEEDKHIKLLALLEVFAAVLSLSVGIIVCIFVCLGLTRTYNIFDRISMTPAPMIILGGVFIMLFTLAYAIIRLIAALKLKNGSNTAKVIILILSVIDLTSFPLGTALGGYAFWVLLFRGGAEEYYEALSDTHKPVGSPNRD